MNLRRRRLPLFSIFSSFVFCAGFCIAVLISPAPASCQGASNPQKPGLDGQHVPVIRVQVNLQPVDVQVIDSKGRPVTGLTAKDFSVFDDGHRQDIAFFDPGSGPVSIVILVDSSSSVDPYGPLGSAEAIAAQFMHIARPGDDISAMDFTDRLGPFQHLTPAQLAHPLASTIPQATSHGSAIYDAIASALCHLRSSKNLRQAVVVISDGDDQHSRLSLDQLIDLVRSSHAQLFMIGLQSLPRFNFEGHTEPKLTLITGHEIDNPAVVFERLMKESGAESYLSDSQRSLESALKAVSDMLDSEYTLAYYPQKSTTKFRKIEVKVDRHKTKVLTRRYVGSSQQAAEVVHFDPGTCVVSPSAYPYPYESNLSLSSAGLIYREDFSDPKSGWPQHPDSYYVSDGYELFNPKNQVAAVTRFTPANAPMTEYTSMSYHDNVIAAYGPWWGDFRATVDMEEALEKATNNASAHESPKSPPAAGLIFRMSSDGYYALLVGHPSGDKKISGELVKRSLMGIGSYVETKLIPWTKINQDSSSEMQLSVKVAGDQITGFVNGQEIGSVQDDAFGDGLVGFVVTGPGGAIFKNLVVIGH